MNAADQAVCCWFAELEAKVLQKAHLGFSSLQKVIYATFSSLPATCLGIDTDSEAAGHQLADLDYDEEIANVA